MAGGGGRRALRIVLEACQGCLDQDRKSRIGGRTFVPISRRRSLLSGGPEPDMLFTLLGDTTFEGEGGASIRHSRCMLVAMLCLVGEGQWHYAWQVWR